MKPLSQTIQVDFRSAEPAYTQIARQIEERVRSGALQPGDQLPTVRELAIDLRINFSTVARAYKLLDEQRWISTQRGRGTYIESPTARETDPDPPRAPLAPVARRALEEARRLGYRADELLAAIRALDEE